MTTHTKDPKAVERGRKGGKARGLRKARPSEVARAAVMVRWDRTRIERALKREAAREAPGPMRDLLNGQLADIAEACGGGL